MLDGKIAVVTGASRGLGLAVTKKLLKQGAKVVMVARTADALERACADLKEDSNLLTVAGDVSSESTAEAVFERARERFGRVDILVNNAGLALLQSINDTTLDQWNQQFAVHVTGPFLMCRQAVKNMISDKIAGRIVNVSSITGETGASMACAYAASKAGLLGFTRALAKEVAPHGITVNSICPGAMDTDMFQKDTIDVIARRFNTDRETLFKRTLAMIPLKRLLDPSEVAELVVFLCQGTAGGITGQTYSITCGFDIH